MSGPDQVAHVTMAILRVVLLLILIQIHRQYLTGAYHFQMLRFWVPRIKIFWQLNRDLGHPLAQHTEYFLVRIPDVTFHQILSLFGLGESLIFLLPPEPLDNFI